MHAQTMIGRQGCDTCGLPTVLLQVGHALDQKRLQQPLYRHPWEDVLYTQ